MFNLDIYIESEYPDPNPTFFFKIRIRIHNPAHCICSKIPFDRVPRLRKSPKPLLFNIKVNINEILKLWSILYKGKFREMFNLHIYIEFLKYGSDLFFAKY